MDLTIDYCIDCSHRDKAVKATKILVENYGEVFDKMTLVPSEGDVFRVSVDGKVIFDVEEDSFSTSRLKGNLEEHLEEPEE